MLPVHSPIPISSVMVPFNLLLNPIDLLSRV